MLDNFSTDEDKTKCNTDMVLQKNTENGLVDNKGVLQKMACLIYWTVYIKWESGKLPTFEEIITILIECVMELN